MNAAKASKILMLVLLSVGAVLLVVGWAAHLLWVSVPGAGLICAGFVALIVYALHTQPAGERAHEAPTKAQRGVIRFQTTVVPIVLLLIGAGGFIWSLPVRLRHHSAWLSQSGPYLL